MILFFTGAEKANTPQPTNLKSLGGLLSSSVIPNNALSNVFGDISLLGTDKGEAEVRGIVLKNTTGASVSNVYLYQTYPVDDSRAKIEWAPVTMPDGVTMEQLSTPFSEPYQIGSWYEPIGAGGKILLATTLVDGGVIGLWVKRTIKSPNPDNSVAAADLDAYLKALTKKEQVVVSLQYN